MLQNHKILLFSSKSHKTVLHLRILNTNQFQKINKWNCYFVVIISLYNILYHKNCIKHGSASLINIASRVFIYKPIFCNVYDTYDICCEEKQAISLYAVGRRRRRIRAGKRGQRKQRKKNLGDLASDDLRGGNCLNEFLHMVISIYARVCLYYGDNEDLVRLQVWLIYGEPCPPEQRRDIRRLTNRVTPEVTFV